MCTHAIEDRSLLHNFDTSKFKKYLSIYAQGPDIKLVNIYKDGVEYIAFQGSSINGPTAPVYNVPNIFFGNEPSLQELAIGEMDKNVRKLNYDGTNYTIGEEITDVFEEGKNLYLHANTFSDTDRSSLIEKICNSIDYSNTNSKHKIIIFNSSCLSVNEDYISAFFALYPEWSEIFGDNYLLGVEKQADFVDFQIYVNKMNRNDQIKKFKEIKNNIKTLDELEKSNIDPFIKSLQIYAKNLKTKEQYEKDIIETKKKYVNLLKYGKSLDERKTKTKKHLKTEKARKSLGKPKLYPGKTRSRTKQLEKFRTYKQKSGKKSNKKFRKFGGKKYKTKKKPRGKKNKK
jgi:hypothetical protein